MHVHIYRVERVTFDGMWACGKIEWSPSFRVGPAGPTRSKRLHLGCLGPRNCRSNGGRPKLGFESLQRCGSSLQTVIRRGARSGDAVKTSTPLERMYGQEHTQRPAPFVVQTDKHLCDGDATDFPAVHCPCVREFQLTYPIACSRMAMPHVIDHKD
jgi:hypothetical protein